SKQYALGLEAGKILKKIHSIPAPESQQDWEIRINNKADLRIRKYNECPLKYDNGQAFIDFVNANRYLLKGRPQVFQHGDYHIGNMMIENDKVVIIDFDRYDFGDPWEEFKSITWCAQASHLFASGMVNGYFDNNVPMEFCNLLALYISLGTITSLPWAIPYGEGEVQTMQNLANEVLEWYDNMQNPVPKWYKNEVAL
ncbi:MAG: phosphotransferase, partial [Clostridia bacterium]|nr:phosphotransferase [Clostridia bacterium]